MQVLASIPLDPSLMSSSDSGLPLLLSHPTSSTSELYRDMADKILVSIQDS